MPQLLLEKELGSVGAGKPSCSADRSTFAKNSAGGSSKLTTGKGALRVDGEQRAIVGSPDFVALLQRGEALRTARLQRARDRHRVAKDAHALDLRQRFLPAIEGQHSARIFKAPAGLRENRRMIRSRAARCSAPQTMCSGGADHEPPLATSSASCRSMIAWFSWFPLAFARILSRDLAEKDTPAFHDAREAARAAAMHAEHAENPADWWRGGSAEKTGKHAPKLGDHPPWQAANDRLRKSPAFPQKSAALLPDATDFPRGSTALDWRAFSRSQRPHLRIRGRNLSRDLSGQSRACAPAV